MRITRAYFWPIAGANILFLAIAFRPLLRSQALYRHGFEGFPIVSFVMLLPIAIAGIGRLHDVGKPGWPAVFTMLFIASLPYWLVLGFLAFISSYAVREGHPVLFDAAHVGPGPALIFIPSALAALFISGRTVLRWLQPSDPDTNRYGPAPP